MVRFVFEFISDNIMRKHILFFFWIFFFFSVEVIGQISARWITSPEIGVDSQNTWIAFRKEVYLKSVPDTLFAQIAADSKYWLWINGDLVVFEGGLKRGPNPKDTAFLIKVVEGQDYCLMPWGTMFLLLAIIHGSVGYTQPTVQLRPLIQILDCLSQIFFSMPD